MHQPFRVGLTRDFLKPDGSIYEIEITVPFHFSGLKGNIVVSAQTSSTNGPDNYYYPSDLTNTQTKTPQPHSVIPDDSIGRNQV